MSFFILPWLQHCDAADVLEQEFVPMLFPSRTSLLAPSIIAMSMLAASTARADDAKKDPDANTETKIHHGGYGAPEIKLTPIASNAGLFMGSQGGWIIDRTFVVGGAGYGLVNDVKPTIGGVESAPLSIGYGGFRGGFVLFSERRIHLTGGVILGGGAASAGPREQKQSAGFFVVEPDVAAELNVRSWLRLTLGGSYRFTNTPEGTGLRAAQLSGPAATFAVKFGSF
jgi:hypothetical protein